MSVRVWSLLNDLVAALQGIGMRYDDMYLHQVYCS